MNITTGNLDFRELNKRVRSASDDVCIDSCFGQRFIGAGSKGKRIRINGTPGNALGAYLDGTVIEVNGNAQDAVGDTMNDGKIIVHGYAGDALGYAMRGGTIFVKGNSGYRTGIHMKEYRNKKPIIVIGGEAGSFLGEYLAGGLIIVLGIGSREAPVGNFTGTGMHGGRIYIRTSDELKTLSEQAAAEVATNDDLREIEPYLKEFAECFDIDIENIMKDRFLVLRPNAKNPYKNLYTEN
jgi:glutamate synthase domain-containing protein 3